MSGIMNKTGAVSGILGTTVGTFDLETATFPDGHMQYITTVTGDGTAAYITIPHDGGHFSASYSYFKIIGYGIRATTNDTHLYMELGDSGGFDTNANYTSAGYSTTHDAGSVSHLNQASRADIYFFNGAASNAQHVISIEIDIYSAHSTSFCKNMYFKAGGARQNSANCHGISAWALWNDTSALTGWRLKGQNNLYGTIKLYGIV